MEAYSNSGLLQVSCAPGDETMSNMVVLVVPLEAKANPDSTVGYMFTGDGSLKKGGLKAQPTGDLFIPKSDSVVAFIEQIQDHSTLFVDYTDMEGENAKLMFSVRRTRYHIDKEACEIGSLP